MTLTSREKNMLYFLFCFLMGAIGFFVFVLPAMSDYGAQKEALTKAQEEFATRQTAILQIDTMEQESKKCSAEIAEYNSRYRKSMHNLELDRIYTSRLTTFKAKPMELTMSEVTGFRLAPFNRIPAEEDAADGDTVKEEGWLPGTTVGITTAAKNIEDVIKLINNTVKDDSAVVDSVTIETDKEVDEVQVAFTLRQFYSLDKTTQIPEIPGLAFS